MTDKKKIDNDSPDSERYLIDIPGFAVPGKQSIRYMDGLPYFEWISADGCDVIGSVFDEISIDPAKEIEKFKAKLENFVAEAVELRRSHGNNKDNSYLVDIQGFAAIGKDVVSDVRLAAQLNHDKLEFTEFTDILYATINGEAYVLRLGDDILADLSLPYFEWISADGGDVIGDVFDEISIHPEQEIEKLRATLEESADLSHSNH